MYPNPAELGLLLQGDELPVVHEETKGLWLQPQHRPKIPFSGREVVASTEGTSGSRWVSLFHSGILRGLRGAQGGLCHLPEGPWVACINSVKKKDTPKNPRLHYGQEKILAILRLPRFL